MSFYMQENGWKALAEMIAGTGDKINGVYAEYSTEGISAGPRSRAWYADMPEGSGYVRLHIANVYVDDSATIHFTAYLTAADIQGEIPQAAYVRCATLVILDSSSADQDKLICTVDVNSPIELNHSEYMVIHAGLRLGDNR